MRFAVYIKCNHQYYCYVVVLAIYLMAVPLAHSLKSSEERQLLGSSLKFQRERLQPRLPKMDEEPTERSGGVENDFLHASTKLGATMLVRKVDSKVGVTLGDKLLPVAERGFTRVSTRYAGNWAGKVAGQIAAKIASARALAIAIPIVGAILLLIDIIWETLKASLQLDVSQFKECHAWERDLNGLPQWLQSILTGIPILGTIFDGIGNKLCFRIYGCEPGMELSNGLCYPPCPKGFFSDGATQCYRNYPEWQANQRLHSLTAITKRLLPAPTPKPVTECSDDQERLGALCYPRCAPGYQARDTVCWKQCEDNDLDQGGLCRKRCADGHNEVAGVCYQACPDGYHNDGATCRKDAHIFGKGCCTVGGWCRNKCPEGYAEDPCTCRRNAHIFGKHSYIPDTYHKHSYVRKPSPLACSSSSSSSSSTATTLRELSKGLCYPDCPEGYRQDTLGFCAQICPAGSRDFGVGCSRERYNRGIGKIPFAIRVKDKL